MRPLIIANWKMNTTLSEALLLANGVKRGLAGLTSADVVLCPPFPWLVPVGEVIYHHPLKQLQLGAQNVFWQESGAYTGEVAAPMLKGLVGYVILGHSERRRVFQETDQIVNQKVKLALASGLRPVICVGEERRPAAAVLDQPTEEAAHHVQQPVKELRAAIKGLTADQLKKIVVAYEPVWAISSNKNAVAATGIYANFVSQLLREELESHDPEASAHIPILYGGSVTAANVEEFSPQPAINGCLVGGASLKLKDFLTICQQFN